MTVSECHGALFVQSALSKSVTTDVERNAMRNFSAYLLCLLALGSSVWADETLTMKDGRQIVVKDDFTWDYVAEVKPITAKYAEEAVSVWDKALLREDSDYEKRIGLYLHYQNNTDKKVIGLIVKVTIVNPFGKAALDTTFEDEVVLEPNERQKSDKFWVFKDNQFIDDEPYDRMSNMADNGTAKINTQILKVVFEDGTILNAKPAPKPTKK